jgi:hypothetical protein
MKIASSWNGRKLTQRQERIGKEKNPEKILTIDFGSSD